MSDVDNYYAETVTRNQYLYKQIVDDKREQMLNINLICETGTAVCGIVVVGLTVTTLIH